MTRCKITDVVKQLLIGRTPGLDDEFHNPFDVVELPLQYHMRSGAVLWIGRLGWCAPVTGWITVLSIPGKVYARVLGRSDDPLVESQIHEEQCCFCPG